MKWEVFNCRNNSIQKEWELDYIETDGSITKDSIMIAQKT